MDVGTPSTNGYDYTYGVWVINLITGEQRQILDTRFAGMAWKPGTHLLAYGHEIDMDYSISRGESDTVQPKGIHTIDLDSGETHYLVAPERGYALSGPNWSPDGRFLAFSESVSMETGMFAYYDLENQEYVAWDESLGSASWSPDGSLLTYDRIITLPLAMNACICARARGTSSCWDQIMTGQLSPPNRYFLLPGIKSPIWLD